MFVLRKNIKSYIYNKCIFDNSMITFVNEKCKMEVENRVVHYSL